MVFGLLFGFRGKVYRLRKKFDRVRERADKMGDTNKRLAALRALDNVESSLIMLEEQDLSRFDRSKFIAAVRMGIEHAKAILEEDMPQQSEGQYYGGSQPQRR